MLKYSVTKSDRKTIAMFVERNNDVVIKAPYSATDEKIRQFFHKKQMWLYTKLEEKSFFEHHERKKEFVNGESFWYLGRIYKLKVKQNIPEKFRWYRSSFEIQEDAITNAREIVVGRYKQKCKEKILPRVEEYAKKYGFIYRWLCVKDLRNRWASCTSSDIINFHWKAILAPIDVIDYIILHELVHTREKKHSPKFWTILSGIMPDYENHKDWLRRNWIALYV